MKLKNYYFLFIDISRVYRNESIEPLGSPIHGQLSTTYRTVVPFDVRKMFNDLAILLLYWSSSRPLTMSIILTEPCSNVITLAFFLLYQVVLVLLLL